MKNFFSDGFSIDETRVSALIITYIIGFFVTIVMCILTKDVDGLKQILFTSIACISGINMTSTIFSANKAINSSTNNINKPITTTNTAINNTASSTSNNSNLFNIPASGKK
jgi:hypothetical protein